MRLLFCCEFYYPSVGGVQEVMRQIAERMVLRGHEVTVATTRLANRTFNEYNGVRIEQFGVTGNLARGIEGEVERYRQFVASYACDALLVKAAQQWTFDALWPVLDDIRARKVFIPCGFSGLYEPAYVQYFEEMPDILRKFDHLIFYAENYRDIDFTRAHGITHWTVLPNGASEIEFSVPADAGFRDRHGIPQDSFVFLTVGSITGVKGHKEVLEAFAHLECPGRHMTLILNGNPPPAPVVDRSSEPTDGELEKASDKPALVAIGQAINRSAGFLSNRARRVTGLAYRSVGVLQREGWAGIRDRLEALVARKLQDWIPESWTRTADPIGYWVKQINRQKPRKLLLKTDLPRAELVQGFMAADLFVFASNIEYSPLVLFESAAAGTPFLTVPVGNAEEIARWTGGGIVCPAPKDKWGYTRVVPKELADAMGRAVNDPDLLSKLGASGKASWEERYTWKTIAAQYEKILSTPT